MDKIDRNALQSMVNHQLVSALGLVTPKGLPHCTPVWVHYFDGKLYIFTKSGRAKVRYASINPNCMVAFELGSMKGSIKLYPKNSEAYQKLIDLPDERYGHNSSLSQYKENWDTMMEITPVKVY